MSLKDSKHRDNRGKSAYHHGDLARTLIIAAREILETEGLAKLSLRGTARRAGVSQAAPYHHFKDKQALLASVATEGHHEFNSAMLKKMDAAGSDPHERLIASGVAYVQFATDNPALFRLMFGSSIGACEQYPDLIAAGARSYQTLLDAKQAAFTDDKDPLLNQLRALNSWCTVHGLATLLNDGGLKMDAFQGLSLAALTKMLLKAKGGLA